MGRVKLNIRKMQNPASRKVTYAKRSNGLTKKVYELSTLCGMDVGVIMFSPSGKMTEYCRNDNTDKDGTFDDDIDKLIYRFAGTPQQERAKRRAENIEYINKLKLKHYNEPGSEAPRAGVADPQQEVQQLRFLLRKAESERDFYAAKERLFAGSEIIDNFENPAQLVDIRAELTYAIEKVEKRKAVLRQNAVEQTSFDMFSGIFAQETIEGLNFGSTRDSPQAMHMHNWESIEGVNFGSTREAMHMHNWDRVSNLDNRLGTSIMANSQMR